MTLFGEESEIGSVTYKLQTENEKTLGTIKETDNKWYILIVEPGNAIDAVRLFKRLNDAEITLNGKLINSNVFERNYVSKIVRIVEQA